MQLQILACIGFLKANWMIRISLNVVIKWLIALIRTLRSDPFPLLNKIGNGLPGEMFISLRTVLTATMMLLPIPILCRLQHLATFHPISDKVVA